MRLLYPAGPSVATERTNEQPPNFSASPDLFVDLLDFLKSGDRQFVIEMTHSKIRGVRFHHARLQTNQLFLGDSKTDGKC